MITNAKRSKQKNKQNIKLDSSFHCSTSNLNLYKSRDSTVEKISPSFILMRKTQSSNNRSTKNISSVARQSTEQKNQSDDEHSSIKRGVEENVEEGDNQRSVANTPLPK